MRKLLGSLPITFGLSLKLIASDAGQFPGSVIESFNPELPVGSIVSSVAVQPDGKILAAVQYYYSPTSSSTRLYRFARSGDRDPEFNSTFYQSGITREILVQEDGNILLAGSFDGGVARLHPDGTLDATFDADVSSSASNGNGVRTIALQPDGRIIIGGRFAYTWDPPGSDFTTRYNLVRLLPNGNIDYSFDSGAPFAQTANEQEYDYSGSERDLLFGSWINDIEQLQSGKMVVAGSFTNFNNHATKGIVRLHSDGSVDETFVTPPLSSSTIWPLVVHQVIEKRDESLLIRGWISDSPWGAVGHLSRDGDTILAGPVPCDSPTLAAAVDFHDGLILGGLFRNPGFGPAKPHIGRLNHDLSHDWGFGSSSNDEGADDLVYTVAMEPGGGVVIGGRFSRVRGVDRPGLALLNADASENGPPQLLDISGPVTLLEGRPLTLSAKWYSSTRSTMHWLHEGTNVTSGYSSWGQQPSSRYTLAETSLLHGGIYQAQISNAVGTFLSDPIRVTVTPAPTTPGALDIAFRPPEMARVSAILVLEDDSFIVGAINVRRLSPNGQEDIQFGELAPLFRHYEGGFRSITRNAATGKILVSGSFTATRDGFSTRFLAKLFPDGSIDSTFEVTFDSLPDYSREVWQAFEDDSGRVLAASAGWITRLLPDGSSDPSFARIGFGGYFSPPAPGGVRGPSFNPRPAFALQGDGSILGSDFAFWPGSDYFRTPFWHGQSIVKFNPNGDPAEGSDQTTSFPKNNPVSVFHSLQDGGMLAARPIGDLGSLGGLRSSGVIKLLPGGSLDTRFHLSGAIKGRDEPYEDFAPPAFPIKAATSQADGRILLAGNFTNLNNMSVNNIIRLFPDGTTDESFHVGAGPESPGGIPTINALGVLKNGSIVVGGNFSSFNGYLRTNLVILHGDAHTPPSVHLTAPTTSYLVGQTATVYAKVRGNLLGKPRWMKDGTEIPHATNTLLQLNDVQLEDAGSYSVAISFPDNELLSDPVTLEVSAFQMQPGSLDESFGEVNIGGGVIESILEDEHRRLIVAGSFTNINNSPHPGIVRLNPDGSVDPTFLPSHTALTSELPTSNSHDKYWYPSVNSLVRTSSGDLVVGGYFDQINGQPAPGLAILDSQGTSATIEFPSSWEPSWVHSLVPLTNSNVQVFSLERTTTTGNFGEVTEYETHVDQLGFEPRAVTNLGSGTVIPIYQKPLSDGTFLVLRDNHPESLSSLSKAGLDGGILSSFPPEQSPLLYGKVTAVEVEESGAFLAAIVVRGQGQSGYFSSIRRFELDGTPVPTFDDSPELDGVVHSILTLPSGKVWAGGSFRFAGNVLRPALASFNEDGSLDEGFAQRFGANGQIRKMFLLRDGRVAITGQFSQIDGKPRSGLAILHTGGTIISGPIQTTGQKHLEINTQKGLIYTLEHANQLNQPVWRDISSTIGDGGVHAFALPEDSTGYYRVRRE